MSCRNVRPITDLVRHDQPYELIVLLVCVCVLFFVFLFFVFLFFFVFFVYIGRKVKRKNLDCNSNGIT